MPESPKKNFFMRIKQNSKIVSQVANDNYSPRNVFWGWIVVIFFALLGLLLIFY